MAGRSRPINRIYARLGDRLQEEFFPETRDAWGEARRESPGHPHPPLPALLEGETCWLCLANGRAHRSLQRVRAPRTAGLAPIGAVDRLRNVG